LKIFSPEPPSSPTIKPAPLHTVVMREKSHTSANPPIRRPVTMGPVVDSPMKMFETPQWKKELMDKKKKRESLNPCLHEVLLI
jgi:hypothetical protein